MQIQIFTDGSCHTQQRIGGWAAIIFLEDEKIELKGVAIGDYSVSGNEPVEPIFEDVSWKAKSAQITATQP